MLKLIKILFVGATISLTWAGLSVAASFDCSKASTDTEKAICADPQLSKLDETLAAVWKIDARDKKVIEEQRVWLTERDAIFNNEICGNAGWCLRDYYKLRVAELLTGCPIDIDFVKKWDGNYPLEELTEFVGLSTTYEECKLSKIKSIKDDFERLSGFIKLDPSSYGCTIGVDAFMYPIPERRGHHLMGLCDSYVIDKWNIFLSSMTTLIQKERPEIYRKMESDNANWAAFKETACDFYADLNDAYPGNGGSSLCELGVVKARILYLSPLIGIDEWYGATASSVEEVLGEFYGIYRE